MSELSRGYCEVCQKHRAIQRSGTNHVLHLLLSVFTAGLWIPAWVIVSMDPTGWRCLKCGAVADTKEQRLGRACLYGGTALYVLVCIIFIAVYAHRAPAIIDPRTYGL